MVGMIEAVDFGRVIDYMQENSTPAVVQKLLAFFKDATKVEVEMRWNKLSLNNARLMQFSIPYVTDIDAVLTIRDNKKSGMSEYMRSNGLLFAEEIRQRPAAISRSGLEAGVSGTLFTDRFKKSCWLILCYWSSKGGSGAKSPRLTPPKGPMRGTSDSNVFDLDVLKFCSRVAAVFSDLNTS